MFFPPGCLQGPKVDTKKALLLIDLQNDFVSPSGNLFVPNTSLFLSKLPALTAKFREKGQIVFVRTIFQQPCSVFSPYTGGYNVMLKKLADYMRSHPVRDESTNAGPTHDDEDGTTTEIDLQPENDVEAYLNDKIPASTKRCCVPGSKGSELHPLLALSIDKQKDMILTKSQYSLFTDPMVVMQLRARLISDLYICGSLSNIGVYATVLDAVQQGFSVTLVEDCLGFRDETCHIEAMKQMADDFGANGIDYSELMDDLHGLLGDVVPASRYTRTFQLSMQAQNATQVSSKQRVNQWMETVESEPEESEASSDPARTVEAIPASRRMSAKNPAPQPNESYEQPHNARTSPAPSPPRKRSTSDRDETEELEALRTGSAQETSHPYQTPESSATSKPTLKKTRRESNTSKTSRGSDSNIKNYPQPIPNGIGQSQSTGHLETLRKTPHKSPTPGRTMSHPGAAPASDTRQQLPKMKSSKQKYDMTYLGPGDTIGENDSSIIHDVLSDRDADEAFSQLKYNTAWQKMFHRSGEVPRLVAVQGIVSPDGTIPIYRHPADESPQLQPFDLTVDWLRKQCEKLIKHPLNHALIQHYRSGEDNISEHSDKTLDIVRGSSIVNLSLGAMRTMTLRTKKSSQPEDAAVGTNGTSTTNQSRTSVRVRLPHNSLFVLGEHTNASWLHSIRPDKRPEVEKSQEELDFNGERISLTFRYIGTFIDPKQDTIWGQGATCKRQSDAQKILHGKEAEEAGERMIIGFGKENHLNDSEFDWQEVYGVGFDVVNFEITNIGT